MNMCKKKKNVGKPRENPKFLFDILMSRYFREFSNSDLHKWRPYFLIFFSRYFLSSLSLPQIHKMERGSHTQGP